MNTRVLLLLTSIFLLLGCQAAEAGQLEPDVIELSPQAPAVVPALQPTVSQTAVETVSPSLAVPPSPFPTLTAATTSTSEKPLALPTAYPAAPTPVVVPDVYPEPAEAAGPETVWSYRVVNEYPHDATAYTQGLVIEDNQTTLLEGTGRDSSLRRVDLQSGQIQQFLMLPDEFFGEGITLFGDRIYQLTWRSETGFVYDSETFEQLARFFYPHQGWGLTHDGTHLIVSDGSDTIRFWDPETIQEIRHIQVSSADGPVTQLNELEYVNGEIWANIWHTDLIARISPEDGRVLGWIDLSGLMDPQLLTDSEAVLNGIAYDDASDRLFVTGKLWPSLFEIEVFPTEGS
ncbi:MAG: glutaminyl-peptide cyclotransferase [Candidatus Promineifilaceae bacterium]